MRKKLKQKQDQIDGMNQGKLDAEQKQKKAEKNLQDFIFAQKEDVRRFMSLEK